MQAQSGDRLNRWLARVDVAIGVLLLLSAAASYAAWADEVRRPGHHGEVAWLFLYAAWACIPGIAFVLAGMIARRSHTRGGLVITQLAALASPVMGWGLLSHLLHLQ